MWLVERSDFGLNALLGLNATFLWKRWQRTKRLDIFGSVKLPPLLNDGKDLTRDDACNESTSLLLRMSGRQQTCKRLAGLRRIALRELIVEDLEDRFPGNV